MVSFLKRLFEVKRVPFIPKIVICFNSSGCMGTELVFEWIGYVTKSYTSAGGVDYYDCRLIVKGRTEYRRDGLEETAYQIQHLVANLYIHYS